jgi:hypothetical protein
VRLLWPNLPADNVAELDSTPYVVAATVMEDAIFTGTASASNPPGCGRSSPTSTPKVWRTRVVVGGPTSLHIDPGRYCCRGQPVDGVCEHRLDVAVDLPDQEMSAAVTGHAAAGCNRRLIAQVGVSR